MDINVKMTAEEFLEFMAYKQDKDEYKKKMATLERDKAEIARIISYAVEPVGTNADEFRIIDQGRMSDLWMMAGEILDAG